MDEIDDQIMAVIRQSPRQSCYEVQQEITDSFGISYPAKRVRNRLDSLCNYKFLIMDTENRGKGRPTNVYSLPERSEGSA